MITEQSRRKCVQPNLTDLLWSNRKQTNLDIISSDQMINDLAIEKIIK